MGRSNRTRRGRLPRPEIRPDDSNLTRFAGAIPLIRFMTEVLGLPSALREIVGPQDGRRRHAVHHVLFAFVVAALVGTERLAHLDWLGDDVVLLKFLRLTSWPVRKVFSVALTSVSDASRLEQLVADVARRTLRVLDSIVVDIDNTAVVDHGTGEGSKFGYCGKGRRRRRHYPIVASVSESRAVIAAKYRDGSEMTNEEVTAFIAQVVARVRGWFGESLAITLRMDGGFWNPALTRWLVAQKIPFVMGLHLVSQVRLALMTATWQDLTGDEDIEFAVVPSDIARIGEGLRIVAIRRRVSDRFAPPQGKVIDESPEWRYQTLITDRDWDAVDVWRFYNHRGDSERVFRVARQALSLGNLVGREFSANETAFLLRLLAYNSDIAFQQHAEEKAVIEHRPVHRNGLEWRQRRFYDSPGRLLREGSRWLLRTATNIRLADLWTFYDHDHVVVSA